MEFKYFLEERPRYLLLTFQGTFGPSLIHEFSSILVHVCRKYLPTKMLCDLRGVTDGLTMTDRFDLGVVFSKKFLEARAKENIAHCRFAILGNHPLIHPQQFGATVARNRGVDVIATTKLEEALSWLELDPSEGPSDNGSSP